MSVSAAPLSGGRERRPAIAREMAAVTWLQHRLTLLAAATLAALFALAIALAGLYAKHVYASLPSCPGTGKCLFDTNVFDQQPWGSYPIAMASALVVLMLLLGVFLAAPLLATEFETGTFRFAWTQELGRRTWLTWKLGLLAGAAVLLAAGLGALFSLSGRPWELAGTTSGWTGLSFQASAMTLAGWAFFAIMLGTLIGAVTRKTVAAMAWTGLALLAAIGSAWWLVRGLFNVAATNTVIAPAVANEAAGFQGPLNAVAPPGSGRLSGAWLVRGWFTGPGGHPVSTAAQVRINSKMPSQAAAQLRWLAQNHTQYHLAYQPASALAVFQGIEALLLIAAGLLCLALVRHLLRTQIPENREQPGD